MELHPNEAHLWCLSIDRVPSARLAEYEHLLTAEERLQQRRFLFEKNQIEYLLTRTLVRRTLSLYAPVDPRDWRFVRNRYGKPAISEPAGVPFRFNLSNTTGMVVCLVSTGREVGVDVEDTTRTGQTVELADSHFAPAEVRALKALPVEQRRRRFFEYWTLKEAYIKARGMGLAIELDKFAFELEHETEIRVQFHPSLRDVPSAWTFALRAPTAQHLVAYAVERRDADPVITWGELTSDDELELADRR